MKITVQVDVQEVLNELFEDFDPQHDTFELDLKDAVQGAIVFDVKRQIMAMQNQKIKDQIVSEVKSLVDLSIKEQIKNDVEEFAKNGKLKERYKDEEPMSVQDWIQLHFTNKTTEYTRTMKDVVSNKAKNCVDEIKSRYDLLFASQVIQKMNDQDMLKEGVFKALMEGTKK